MPPRRHERQRRDVPVAPRVPGAVHLVPEADDDRVAEIPDTVRIRAQVVVVVTCGDRRNGGVGGIDLHEWDNAVAADHLCERWLEGLRPAAVVADKVRLGACRLCEVRDRLVIRWRPGYIDAQVRGRVGRERRMHGRWAEGQDKGRAGEGDGGGGELQSDEQRKAGAQKALFPAKMTRLTTARLSKPKNTRTANCVELRVTVRQIARAAQISAMPPLHPATQIRKRRSALPGVRDGCQPLVLPRALSQMAKTCAQPRAIPSGQTDGPYLQRCHKGYRTDPASMAGRRMAKFRSLIWPGRKASMTMGMSGPKNVSRPV